MARLPPAGARHRPPTGWARWHSIGGRYVVSVTSAHVVFIIWGYAVTGQKNVVQ